MTCDINISQISAFEKILPTGIIIYHIYGTVVSFTSYTKLSVALHNHNYTHSIILIISVFLTLYFFLKVKRGPGYVDTETTSLLLPSPQSFYCKTCKISPPLRASHCRTCGKCVLRRDHHCPWVGTCIGMKNHFNFILYLIAEFISLSLFIYQNAPAALIEVPMPKWLYSSFQSAIITGIASFGLIQPIILIPVHTLYMLLNYTTWERKRESQITYLKGWKSQFSPFSKGIIGNVKEFVTMANNQPVYKIPEGDADVSKWKADNSFLTNDKYDCC